MIDNWSWFKTRADAELGPTPAGIRSALGDFLVYQLISRVNRGHAGEVKRLRGAGGISVEAVEYVDRLGYRRRVLRARQYERHLGDFGFVEALAKVIDVSKLVEEDDGQADEEGP